MEWLALLAVVAVAIAVIRVSKRSRYGHHDDYPYTRNDVLFSAAERSFLGVLDKAVSDQYRVFGKVRIADIVSVKAIHNRTAWQRAFNRISSKHVDFLLCAKDDLSIKAAVELNDRSHEARERQERDQFLSELCRAISLPLIIVRAQKTYSVAELRETVVGAISGEVTPSVRPETGPRHQGAPSCPKCSAPMALRLAKTGANAGREFWGCTAYPRCRGTAPAESGTAVAPSAE